MATEFPIRNPWIQKPPSGVMLDYSGRLMRNLFYLADGREKFGTQYRDFSQNANHATLSGSHTRNPDGSINYSGASAKATVTGSTSLFNFFHNGIGAGSVSAWVKLDATEPNDRFVVFQNRTSSAQNGITLTFDDRSSASRDHVIFASVTNKFGFSAIAFSTASGVPKDTGWHHVCAVYDTSVATSSQCVWLYVDGVEITQESGFDNTLDFTPDTGNASHDLVIGNYPSSDRQWEGDIDNVEIYNKALSASEVKWLYQNRWHAYMPMMGFISSTDPTPGTAHPHYYMRRRYCA